MARLFVYCVGRFDRDGVAADSPVPVNDGEMCSNRKEQQCNIISALSCYITRGRPGGGDWGAAASPHQRDFGENVPSRRDWPTDGAVTRRLYFPGPWSRRLETLAPTSWNILEWQ